MDSGVTVHLKTQGWKTLLRPYCKTVQDVCEQALGATRHKDASLTVVLADDAFIKNLNRDFRGHDKPTNVLSFPSGEKGKGCYLGDIVLALSTVKREAKAQKKTPRDHATHLLVHGVLHLLGHDHMKEKEAEAMERKEIKILKNLGISNPYLS